MRVLRAIAALATVASALLAIAGGPLEEYRCNLAKRAADLAAQRAEATASEFDRQKIATAALGNLREGLEARDADWRSHFLAGRLNALAQRPEMALIEYQKALHLQRRADIYGAIGALHLKEGNPAEATANLEKAAAYDLSVVEVFDVALRQQLFKIYYDRNERLLRAKQRKSSAAATQSTEP